jgi:diguanylate cyclase (GGDEF)-like protein
MRFAGGPISDSRVRIVSVAVVVGLALFTALFAWWAVKTSAGDFAAQRNVREAMFANQRLLRMQLDEETGLRGFTTTGQRLFLEPYSAARTTFSQVLGTLRSDIAASGVVTKLPDELAQRNDAWLSDVARPILAGHADQLTLQLRGKSEMDRFRRTSKQLFADLNRRADQIDADASRSIAIIIAFAGMGCTLASVGAGMLVLRDVARRSAIAARLTEISQRDPLTGLLNRGAFTAALDDRVAASRANGSVFALAFVDLNGFKKINDRHGHATGDIVLQQVAARLAATARERDVIARLGGDEFVILLDDDADGTAAVNRLEAALLPPHVLDTVVVSVGASIGCALFPADGHDAPGLLHAADLAMYSEKKARALA